MFFSRAKKNRVVVTGKSVSMETKNEIIVKINGERGVYTVSRGFELHYRVSTSNYHSSTFFFYQTQCLVSFFFNLIPIESI